MHRRLILATLAVLVLVTAGSLAIRVVMVAQDLPEAVTASRFEDARTDPRELRAFLQRMPKGGDLHTHLSGAVYAERLIAWGARDGLCLRRPDMVLLVPPADATAQQPCGADPAVMPLAEAVAGLRGQQAHDLLVDAFSMRWFLPTPAVPSGHDQFFGTFGRFDAATQGPDWQATAARFADMTFDQLKQYDAAQVQYAELMVTLLQAEERRRLAHAIGAETDPPAMLAALERAGLSGLVAERARQMQDLVARIEALRGCAGDAARPGCGVNFRFIAQINRNAPLPEIFAQTAFAAALVRAVPGIVAGLNYVGPEDYRISLADYRTHMGFIRFLAGTDVPVALHAGELWLGLVPPPELEFHIRAAVETAGARRIGHGTAIGFERDMETLLQEMRRRGVAVEIALTSSDVILGVRGREHPITTYLTAGVPVVLATDDAGVSRIDLTNEYVRAARDHGLDYRTLKALARNALTHAFLAPKDQAAEIARFEHAVTGFERAMADQATLWERLKALARGVLP